jgi:hypothetical protein
MTGTLRRQARVRINRPGTDEHGLTGSVLNDLLDDQYWIGLDECTSDGRLTTVARIGELTVLSPDTEGGAR